MTVKITKRKAKYFACFVFLTLLISATVQALAGEKEELRRFNNEELIEVEAVFLNPLLKESDNVLQFELRISTHTKKLADFNPNNHAYLQIGNGMLHRSIDWLEQKRDSRHIEGILKFIGPIPEYSNQIQLFLHDLGGVNKREFKWLLPISRK